MPLECTSVDGYDDIATAPYIDHLHVCTRATDDKILMFGTTGHTNNHDGDHQGYMPMVFMVELDADAEVMLNTLVMKEISNSGAND